MKMKKVLVVDDEHHILFILEQELQQHGCVVTKAETGSDALKLIDTNTYDLVILDIMMPELSGIEVAKKILSNKKLKKKPIIVFLTADKDESDKEECLSLGIADFITKPFSPKRLAAHIKDILDKHTA